MSETIELDGLTFSVSTSRDEYMSEPWKEYDIYGIVSEWTNRDKRPGERVLVDDPQPFGRSRRYYDVQGTMARALKDGWGCGKPEGKTKRQIAAEAVEEDYRRLKAWCDDEWYYVSIRVVLLDVDGHETNEREYLGAVESDQDGYILEQARELAEIIADRIDGDMLCVRVRQEEDTHEDQDEQ